MVRLTLGHHCARVFGMNPSAELMHLLSRTGPILLDFDGPVCGVFAGYPATAVADELRTLLVDRGADLTETVINEADPLQVLRWTMTLKRPEVTRAVEDALCAAELRAVESAVPTPYAREVIVAAHQAGRPVAIVSNNSAPAITEYLTAHRLASYVEPVVGRAYAQPERMKPSPDPILHAVGALGAEPRACVLVGDSATDVTSSSAAGVHIIGYANKPPKAALLTEAGANIVITSMSELATPLLQAQAH